MILLHIKGSCAVYEYSVKNLRDFHLYTVIERLAGAYEAIEATSWAEIADIGETYEHEFFTLTIIED